MNHRILHVADRPNWKSFFLAMRNLFSCLGLFFLFQIIVRAHKGVNYFFRVAVQEEVDRTLGDMKK